MNLFRLIVTILMSVTFLVSQSQTKQTISIIDFKVEDKVDFASGSMAEMYAYQDDIGVWALLILEFNGEENHRKLSILGNAEGIPGRYEKEEFKGDYKNEKGHRLRNLSTGEWYTPTAQELAEIKRQMSQVRKPNQKWYSLLPDAVHQIRLNHVDYNIEDKEWYNSAGKYLGRTEGKFFIPNPQLMHEGFFKGGMTYRLVLDIPVKSSVAEPEPDLVPGFATFTTDPVGATVTVMQYGETKATGVANPSFMAILPYGTYNYTVSAPNYHSEEGTLVIGAEEQTPSIKLRPAFGSLTINSTPQGASVIIDGMAQSGVTPLTIPQLPSGSHTITLSKADYSQATRTVTITDGQQTVENISLDARFALVTINSFPGASIYVDNRLVGTGSYSGNLNSGIHILKATLKSHKDATDNIQVVAKVPQTVELKPTPIYGRLTVGSSPRGADIVIDGVKRGVTPMNITDLLVGEYDVVISKAGYASHSQHIIVEEKTPVIINPTLQSGRSVTITTGTAGDAIYVDGSYVGTSPVTAELAFGSHTLRATRNDKGKQIETSETVTVGQGSNPLTFNLRLKSGALSPNWSSSATAEQRRIIGELIESMVLVEGGTFYMGAQATDPKGQNYDPDAESYEKPTHRVTLSDYYIGKYEVTQEQWQAVMGKNPSYYKGSRKPVERVCWNDCQEFIKKLKSLTGLNFALPTEAQWEYAARGGNKSRGNKYSGSNNIESVAWYWNNSSDGTKEVGRKQSNELGLYDMSGNVWESCQDWRGSYSSSPQTDPTGPSTGSLRVLRGGSWGNDARDCRVSLRHDSALDGSDGDHGLRLAINIDENSDVKHDEVVSIPGGLMPRWSSSATAEQKRILGELIESMVMVEGGTFTMGATSEQGSYTYYNEKPTHRVTLSDYYIGAYEVTQEQWQAVMGKNPSNYKGSRKPVETVSWNDCQEFIKKLNSLTGLNFKLPTEAQWEYAARGGNKSRGYKYSGSNDIESVAWYYGSGGAKEVGQKDPNELGLYDMSGNVWEWCQDWYDKDYYKSNDNNNPTGPSTGSRRVNRGGGWYYDTRDCRVSYRSFDAPDSSDYYLGLRLAVNIDENSDVKHDEDVSISTTLTPNWSSSATAEQKRIIGELIESMVMVEGGTFTMGATSEQGGDAESDEKPTHRVTLSDYYIGKYEVTQEQWQAVMGNNPSNFKGNRKPVEQVSWNDCQEFIKKLNSLTGLNFVLPTEAQWEYAARGGNKSRGYKYSGSNKIKDVAYYDKYSGGPTMVGSKQANELGLYDMSGNVYEWCQDLYGSYSSSSQTDPAGPSTGSYRVIRGGSWSFIARGCRVSNRRNFNTPDYGHDYLGLRLVASQF